MNQQKSLLFDQALYFAVLNQVHSLVKISRIIIEIKLSRLIIILTA